MLKQMTIRNLYNFKNELTFDFINDGSQGLNMQYGPDYISNFTLIYGKNNVGKSNLLKLMDEVKDFVLLNLNKLKPYWPKQTSPTSLFEVIIENKYNEIRYGFEINLETKIIFDEWLYYKKPLDHRETQVFSRLGSSFSPIFDKNDLETLSNVKSTVLYLNYFNNLNHKQAVISTVIDFFKSITLIKCDRLSRELANEDLANLLKLSNHSKSIKLLNAFLSAADVDISKVEVIKLSKNEKDLLKTLKKIARSQQSPNEKKASTLLAIEENKEAVANILGKKLLNFQYQNFDKNLSLGFIHKSKAHFEYADLSSGTKKILSIALFAIDSIKSDKILLFDEIENNLHIELIHLTLSFIKSIVNYSPELQIIISTHRDELLDYSFISNENKLFLKIDPVNLNLSVDYLSQYKLKEYHLASKRYALNAFNTSPNTSKEYQLNMLLDSLFTSGDNDE